MKYLIALILSNLLCGFLALVLIGFNTSLLMYLFLFLPAVFLGLNFYYKRSSFIHILETITSLALLICFILFWTANTFKNYLIIDNFSIAVIAFLLLNIIFSLLLPKTNSNSSLGIKTQLTLNDPEIWTKTQNMTSYYMIWTFIPLFLLIFYLSGWTKFILSIIILLLPLMTGVIYSNVIGRKIIEYENDRDKKELAEQIEKEQGYQIQGRKDGK